MRVGPVLAAVVAAMLLVADARGGSSGPMVRGDGGSAPSGVAAGGEISADSATLVIRGRAWSLDGGPPRTRQRLTLHRGSTLTVVDDGVSRHGLVEVAGSRVRIRKGTSMTGVPMRTIAFAAAGVYSFRAASVLTVTVEVR